VLTSYNTGQLSACHQRRNEALKGQPW